MQPTFFNGTLDVWRDDGAWRASLKFRESDSTFDFASMTTDDDKVTIAFTASNEVKKDAPFQIRGSMRNGKLDAEAQWEPVPWAPLGGYRTSSHVPTVKPVDETAISGVVSNPDGSPASGADVVIVVADQREQTQTDASGHFKVHAPAPGNALLYANAQGKSVRLQGAFEATKSVTLKLAEPGVIEGTFTGAAATATAWLTPGKVAAPLPGIWGRQATVTGNHFRFEGVPAGDLEVNGVVMGDGSSTAAHVLVHVDPGTTATVTIDPKAATASIAGKVLSAGPHHEEVGYEAFLLMPDDSPEAWYPVRGGRFGFASRTPGDRVVLLVAHGFKPRRVPVTLEAGKAVDLGDVLLEPASASAGN
jgi:hypothetical protein